jgi:DNA adenine methylase
MNVALGLQPKRALLADANPHLVNFYQQLRDPRPFEIKMENNEALFYAYRNCFNELAGTSGQYTRTAAELFYFLNRTCFNGVCRFNRAGKYNVPFGAYSSINYRRDFSDYAAAFRGWDIRCQSFEQLDVQADDFLYCDPPYDGTFTDYSSGGFSWEQQVYLAQWAARHPGPAVMSNQATDRILDLYRSLGFDVRLVEVARSVSAKGDRKPAMEMLAMRNIATERTDSAAEEDGNTYIAEGGIF